MMNAEELKKIYNENFLSRSNRWSTSSNTRSLKIASHINAQIKILAKNCDLKKLLDVGCATGYYSDAFQKIGFEVTGLDYSDVAVKLAKEKFPRCHFVQMNGFEPEFTSKFDVIFCKGFSGFNTHDLNFISSWANQYISLLNPNGILVIGYSSNFSGQENLNETVNHTKKELVSLQGLIKAKYCGQSIFHYFGTISRIKKFVFRILLRSNKKIEYYLYFQKP
ncbi:MAG: class I SAM-dependent methyltransferase [Cyclobacteriaceae bacterium]|jgi:2-polyprenyl-3-methyl-5-hydroxy-6-metoxy-1,4-benzoquinol methylase